MAGRGWLIAGAVNGALAVIFGAYTAHAPGLSDAARHAADTGVRYHMWHSLALVLVAILLRNAAAIGPRRSLEAAAWAFLVGIVFFSFGLYLRELLGITQFAFLVPTGGTAFIVGWLLLAWYGVRAWR